VVGSCPVAVGFALGCLCFRHGSQCECVRDDSLAILFVDVSQHCTDSAVMDEEVKR
jgi:hypothetical protein